MKTIKDQNEVLKFVQTLTKKEFVPALGEIFTARNWGLKYGYEIYNGICYAFKTDIDWNKVYDKLKNK